MRSARIALTATMVVVGLLGIGAVIMSAGVAGATASIFAALLPAPVLAGLVLLFDRYEPEPPGLLMLTFGFGATGAVAIGAVLGIFGQGMTMAFFGQQVGEFLGTVAIAPVVEEIAKGAAVLVVFWRLKDRFNGVVDGVVYAAMVGLGFHFAEDVLYYSGAFLEGPGAFTSTVLVRGVFSAFTHPLFTAMFGIGVALAAEDPRWRPAGPLLGLVGAISLHAIWNAATYLGEGFILVYLGVFIPVLAVVVAVTWIATRREGQVLRTYLNADVSTGLLTDEEVGEVASPRRRHAMVRFAAQQGGVPAREARKAFHQAAAQLAFYRYRRRLNPPDPEVELGWVRAIARYKRWVDSAWAVPSGIGEL